MNELRECGRRGSRPATSQAGQAGEHGVGLLESNVLNLAAVPRVPAQRRPPEPTGLIDQHEDDVEGVGEADVIELCGRRESDRGVAGVERAAKPAVG